MLGKLIKHEWRDTWRMPAGLMLVLALLTLIGVFMTLPLDSFLEFEGNGVAQTAIGFYVFAYILVISFSSFAIYIYFILRFKNNMYGEEAYLMHSLPVTAGQHIIAKALVSTIWAILSVIGIITSLAIFVLAHADVTLQEILRDVEEGFRMMFLELAEEMGMPAPLCIIVILLICIFSLLSTSLLIYFSISLGQQAKKHKIFLAFVSFFVLVYVEGRVFLLISDLMNLDAPEGFWIALICEVLTCTIYYLCNSLLMTKRLNLE